MPADSGMAFVVVAAPRSDPREHARELLGAHTRMPVAQAATRRRVEPDHVYVIPPNAELTIENGVLRLQPPRRAARPRMPDRLLLPLAGGGQRRARDRRRPVGHGHRRHARPARDQGARRHRAACRRRSGQVRRHAAQRDRHRRWSTTCCRSRRCRRGSSSYARHLRVAARRPRGRRCRGRRRPPARDLRPAARAHRPRLLPVQAHARSLRRIQRRMQLHRIDVVAGLRRATCARTPTRPNCSSSDLLIGVTQFFRDREAFDALERAGDSRASLDGAGPTTAGARLGAGLRHRRGGLFARDAAARAPCERLERARTVQIFATDIDERGARRRARSGLYPASIVERRLAGAAASASSRSDGDGYRVSKELREMCVFAPHNVIADPPFSRARPRSPAATCSSTSSAELQQKLRRRSSTTRCDPGGYLFLGPSETVGGPTGSVRVASTRSTASSARETCAARRDERSRPRPAPAACRAAAAARRARPRREQPSTRTSSSASCSTSTRRPASSSTSRARSSTSRGATGTLPAARRRRAEHQHPRHGARRAAARAARALHAGRQDGRPVIARGPRASRRNGGVAAPRPDGAAAARAAAGERALPRRVPGAGAAASRARRRRDAERARRRSAGRSSSSASCAPPARPAGDRSRSSRPRTRSSSLQRGAASPPTRSCSRPTRSCRPPRRSCSRSTRSSRPSTHELHEKVEELTRTNSDLQNLLQQHPDRRRCSSTMSCASGGSPPRDELFRLIDSDIGRPLTDIARHASTADSRRRRAQVLADARARRAPGPHATARDVPGASALPVRRERHRRRGDHLRRRHPSQERHCAAGSATARSSSHPRGRHHRDRSRRQ